MSTVLHNILMVALIIMSIVSFACLLRAVIGPKVADRLMAINMLGTAVIVIIAILTILLNEGYLADICIIYAIISFLAVIILAKLYIGTFNQKGEETK